MNIAAFLKSKHPIIKHFSKEKLFGNSIFRLPSENEYHIKNVGIISYTLDLQISLRELGAGDPLSCSAPWQSLYEAWAYLGPSAVPCLDTRRQAMFLRRQTSSNSFSQMAFYLHCLSSEIHRYWSHLRPQS